jgi:acetyl-CoA synthetase/acetyltransferase
MGYVGNPLDPWGAADPATAYGACFEALAASGAYDVLAVVHDFPYRSLVSEVATANEVTRRLLAATADRPDILPVYVSLTSGEPPPETKAVLDGEGGGAPLLRGAVEAFTAIASVARWEGRRSRRLDTGPWRDAWPDLAADRTSHGLDAAPPPDGGGAGRTILSEFESLALLGAAGLPVSAIRRAADADEAVAAADALGYPVAVKLDATGFPHKSDVGGVRVGLADAHGVRFAAADLLSVEVPHGAAVRGIVIQPMAAPGVELIVGMERDAQFGPAILVGLGGILAEAIDDVAIRLAPVPRDEAHAMLVELRAARLLHGFRGGPAVDLESIVDVIVGLGRFALDHPDVAEVDMNPVITGPGGAVIVDALVVREVVAHGG